MTPEEVLKGLRELAEYLERRWKHDAADRREADLFYMNTCAEAAVLIMETIGEGDDWK